MKKAVVVAAGAGGDMIVGFDRRRSPANNALRGPSFQTRSLIECCVYTKESEKTVQVTRKMAIKGTKVGGEGTHKKAREQPSKVVNPSDLIPT